MFERLTERTSDGIAYTKIPLNESHLNKRGVIEQCFTGFVADRLAAYEDIGLSPEEITDMIYRFEAFLCEMTGNRMSKSNYTLDAMISAANDYQQSLCDGCWDRSELAKYYELEHEKRLVVLPCKAGDIVYTIIDSVDMPYVKQEKVIAIELWSKNGIMTLFVRTPFGLFDFGKTVFLAREAAEKALGNE